MLENVNKVKPLDYVTIKWTKRYLQSLFTLFLKCHHGSMIAKRVTTTFRIFYKILSSLFSSFFWKILYLVNCQINVQIDYMT